MTRIILVAGENGPATDTIEDPRSRRELVKAINTGQMVIGRKEGGRAARRQQWALSQPGPDLLMVRQKLPPVRLSPRMYDVLYGLADGLLAEQIARQLSISRRTVYTTIAEMKRRFGVQTRVQLIAQAIQKGILCE